MLDPRYNNDERPAIRLDDLQLTTKQQVERKVKEGRYEFEKVPCPVCDGNNFESLANKDRYGLYMPVVICTECGLILTNPRMTQQAYSEFYNREYHRLYNGEEHPTDKFFRFQHDRGRRIFNYLANNGFREHDNVLEVGTGAGGILHYFRERGCRVKGIDVDEEYIAYGRDQHQLDLSAGTTATLDLDESPDLVIYSHVLEHVLAVNDELRRVREVLSDTGLLYVAIPGVANLLNSYEMDFLHFLQNAHVWHFTLRSLTNLLARNGFERLAGDEVVDGIFRKAQPGGVESDYAAVQAYLQMAEGFRLRRSTSRYGTVRR